MSVDEAGAFATWLAQRDNRDYRLPTLDDMLALADQPHNGGSAENEPRDLQRLVVAEDPRSLSEWLQCAPDHGDRRNGLRCIAYPAWLRKDGRANTRGALKEGRYPFVTFRLVRTIGQ